MTSNIFNLFFDDLVQQLGDRKYFTVRDLFNLGFFGSEHSVRLAMREGRLGYVKISSRRRLIPKDLLLDFLKRNTSSVEESKRLKGDYN